MTTRRRSNEVVSLFERPPIDSVKATRYSLSEPELDVLCLLQEGLYDQEIADRLYISKDAVADRVGSIVEKMGVRSRTEAAVRALKEGIVTKSALTAFLLSIECLMGLRSGTVDTSAGLFRHGSD